MNVNTWPYKCKFESLNSEWKEDSQAQEVQQDRDFPMIPNSLQKNTGAFKEEKKMVQTNILYVCWLEHL